MSVVIVLGAASLFIFSDTEIGQFISHRKCSVFRMLATPTHDPELRDDVDYMPVDKRALGAPLHFHCWRCSDYWTGRRCYLGLVTRFVMDCFWYHFYGGGP